MSDGLNQLDLYKGTRLSRLRLTLPYPPSANEYWRASRGRGLVPSEKAERFKAEVRRLVPATPLIGDLVLRACFYRPRKAGDLSNRLKVLEDALIGLAYLDDAQIEHIGVSRSDTDPAHPRVELELTGDRFATPEEQATTSKAKQEASTKRRATLRKNRAAKNLRKLEISSAVRRPR